MGWGNIRYEVQVIEEYKEGYKEEYKVKNEYKFSKESFFLPFLNISYLHYENGKGFFLSWGKFYMVYSKKGVYSIFDNLFLSILHLELGFSLLKSNYKKNIDL